MANKTQRHAKAIHSTNPQFLVERVIRGRIYESLYWKEHCFALTAESLIDRAVALNAVGGTVGGLVTPTHFICLVLKLLQLQPEKEIVLEYLRAEEFKYLRALAAFYVRLTFDPIEVYETLEPMLADSRKLRMQGRDGSYYISYIDEFIDSLLTEERVCEVQLPRITQRRVLEETEGLPRRKSALAKAMGIDIHVGLDGDRRRNRSRSQGSEESDRYISRSPTPRSGSGSPTSASRIFRQRSPSAGEEASRYISRSPSPAASGDEKDRYISRSPSPASDRYISQSPTPSPPPENGISTQAIGDGDIEMQPA